MSLSMLCVVGVLVAHGQDPTLAASIATNGSTQIQGTVRPFGSLFPPPPPGFVHEKTVILNPAKRPYMGVQIRDLSAQLAKFFQVEDGGVLVEAVEPEGPADEAGVKAGDILVGLGDTAITGTDVLFRKLDKHAEGDEVTLRLVRREKRWETKLTLATGRMRSSTVTLADGNERPSQSGSVVYSPKQIPIDIQRFLQLMEPPMPPGVFPGRASAREQEALRRELDALKREMQELRKTLQQVRESIGDGSGNGE